MISKEDLASWKMHPVTIAFYDALMRHQFHIKEELAQTAGIDPLADRYKVGYLVAISDMQNVQLEDGGIDV